MTKKVETNLEHYVIGYDFLNTIQDPIENLERFTVAFRKGAYESFCESEMKFNDWLLSPYEQPKRYQMTQFEYDMIKSAIETYYGSWTIKQLSHLRYMKESLGYFKNVPTDIGIGDVLENAKVIE